MKILSKIVCADCGSNCDLFRVWGKGALCKECIDKREHLSSNEED